MSERREPVGTVSKRRSWSILIAWAAAIIMLALLGSGLGGRLAPMSLAVPGTPSSRAEAMLTSEFGNTVPIAVLLRGPPAEVDLQGQRLTAALRAIKQVQVLSPWDGSSMARSLRPAPGARSCSSISSGPRAARWPWCEHRSGDRPHRKAPGTQLPDRRGGDRRAIQEATMSDTLRAEMIALPVLILVLLLVFRSPVAAVVPLAMGGATVMAGHGLLWLASFITPINSLGVAIAAMMSLALGVDYALLMVSRVRQEPAAGWAHEAAVAIAARTAAHDRRGGRHARADDARREQGRDAGAVGPWRSESSSRAS